MNLFLRAFLFFVIGVVFFITYYYLSVWLSGTMSFGILLLLFLFSLLFYFRQRFAPSLDILTFLEQYAEGKLSTTQTSKNDLPGPLTSSLTNSSLDKNNEISDAQTNSKKTSFGQRFWQKISFPSLFAGKKKAKSVDSQIVLPVPGPIFAGFGQKHAGDVAAAYEAIKKKDYSQALHWLRKGIMRYAGKKILQNDLAVLYYMNQKYEEALLEIEKISMENQESALVFYNLALIYMRKKMYQKSLHFLQKSNQIKENAPAHYHIASLFARAGKWEKTANHLDQCRDLGSDYGQTIKKDPNFVNFLVQNSTAKDS